MIKKFTLEYEFLSNSYPSTFFYHNVKYKSVAHGYYSLKAKNESDAVLIRGCLTATEAIKLGKTKISQDNWQAICESVMKDLLRQKFDNPFLSHKLLETKDEILGDTKNFVGKLLMEVREELKLKKKHDDNINKNTKFT